MKFKNLTSSFFERSHVWTSPKQYAPECFQSWVHKHNYNKKNDNNNNDNEW